MGHFVLLIWLWILWGGCGWDDVVSVHIKATGIDASVALWCSDDVPVLVLTLHKHENRVLPLRLFDSLLTRNM